MSCRTCDELFDVYKDSITLFRNAVWKFAGVQGSPDSKLAAEEMNRLQQTCMDANGALREHMSWPHFRSESS